MSLPGLGLEEPEEIHNVEIVQHDLAKDAEWRFEVAVGKYVQVKVSLALSRLCWSRADHRNRAHSC